MNISRGKVVQFHYTLKSDQGEVLESTQGSEPMAYLHGYRNIIDSLEEVLEGRESGDKFTATIEARDRSSENPEDAQNKHLNIEIEVLDVREATPEETAHGHAHGVGGHHH